MALNMALSFCTVALLTLRFKDLQHVVLEAPIEVQTLILQLLS